MQLYLKSAVKEAILWNEIIAVLHFARTIGLETA